MSYASLMVYVEADATPERRVRLAASLADKFAAMLIGVSALAIPPPVVADGMVMAASTDDDIELMRAKLADKGNWFRRVAGCDHRTDEGAGRCLQGTRSGRSNSEDGSSDPGCARGSELAISRAYCDRLEGYARSASSHAGRTSVPARGNARYHCRSMWAGRREDRIGTARRRSPLSVVPSHQRRAQSHVGAKGIWSTPVDPDRSRGTGRPAGHRRLRTQPPGRVDLRRHDARADGGKSHLLPHVALSSDNEWLLEDDHANACSNRFPRDARNTGRPRFDREACGPAGAALRPRDGLPGRVEGAERASPDRRSL